MNDRIQAKSSFSLCRVIPTPKGNERMTKLVNRQGHNHTHQPKEKKERILPDKLPDHRSDRLFGADVSTDTDEFFKKTLVPTIEVFNPC